MAQPPVLAAPTITVHVNTTSALHNYLRKELEVLEIAAAAVQLFTPAFLSTQPVGTGYSAFSAAGDGVLEARTGKIY